MEEGREEGILKREWPVEGAEDGWQISRAPEREARWAIEDTERERGAAERMRECNLVYCRAACRDYPVCQAGICICLLRVWAKSLAQQRLQIGEGTREPQLQRGMDGGGE